MPLTADLNYVIWFDGLLHRITDLLFSLADLIALLAEQTGSGKANVLFVLSWRETRKT